MIREQDKEMANGKFSDPELALRTVFPSAQAWADFAHENDRRVVNGFVRFAKREGLIPRAFDKLLEAFIAQADGQPLPADTIPCLSELLDDKAHLQLERIGSTRNLVAAINRVVETAGLGSAMQVSAAMFSRLRQRPADTPQQRNALRSLAFWIGYSRPHLAGHWHFETLRLACDGGGLPAVSFGARVGFCLLSLGDAIDTKTVVWVRREIDDTLALLGHISPFKRGQVVRYYDTTSLFVDLPGAHTMAGIEETPPSAFADCVRDAVALTYQLLVRWRLSPHASPGRRLRMAIATGEFAHLDATVKPLLLMSVGDNHTIRVSEEARLAIAVNDIRAQFHESCTEITQPIGNTIRAWSLTGVLNPLYWDFVPALLHSSALATGSQGSQALRCLIGHPETTHPPTETLESEPILSLLIKSPRHPFLALETAKVLFWRGHFWDANEILRMLLCVASDNLVARTLRMTIYWNLGLRAQNYTMALRFYEKAESEACFALTHCKPKDEDFFCEYAFARVARAIQGFRLIRKANTSEGADEDIRPAEYAPHRFVGPDDVRKLLGESVEIFQQGMTVAPWGHRTFFCLLCVKSFMRMLEADPNLFRDGRELHDHGNLALQTSMEEFTAFGYLRPGQPGHEVLFEGLVQAAVKTYDTCAQLRAFRPTAKLAFAILAWDFMPRLTMGIARMVIGHLQEAEALALALDDGLYIYAINRLQAEMMDRDSFVAQVRECRNAIAAILGNALEIAGDDELVNDGQPVSYKLFTANICR